MKHPAQTLHFEPYLFGGSRRTTIQGNNSNDSQDTHPQLCVDDQQHGMAETLLCLRPQQQGMPLAFLSLYYRPFTIQFCERMGDSLFQLHLFQSQSVWKDLFQATNEQLFSMFDSTYLDNQIYTFLTCLLFQLRQVQFICDYVLKQLFFIIGVEWREASNHLEDYDSKQIPVNSLAVTTLFQHLWSKVGIRSTKGSCPIFASPYMLFRQAKVCQ